MNGLKVSLLGQAEIRVGDSPIHAFYSRKGLWLFALLSLRNGREVERSWLAATLWPDAAESTGLFYLRRELSSLRKALGGEARRLESPISSTLRLDLSGVEYDVEAFDKAASKPDQKELERATQLYRGPLLEGCPEEWAAPERQNRELAYAAALETLGQMALMRSDLPAAIPLFRKLVTADPFRESAHRSLIHAFAMDGDLAAARKVFRDLRILLHRELNAEPDPETLDLVVRIRTEARQKANRIAQRPEGEEEAQEGFLPQPLTSLVGRIAERESIQEMLDASRLVTLTGTGGVGKTRLALDVAERIKGNYANGAWFVDLAAISDAKLIGPSIASVLGIREVPGRAIEQVLAERLRSRAILVVLDNCEQVVKGAAEIVQGLLQHCGGLKVLATSRQSLGVTGESTFRVPSLGTPPDFRQHSAGGQELEYDAVRLFVERAGQASNGFTLSPQNGSDVARICHRLGGIPLAIELAAARVHTIPVSEIAKRLDDRFALLAGGVRSGVPRQQTLRASVDWSYEMLSDEERCLFRRLSVFSGGFKLSHVEAICDGGLHPLLELVDKSLVFFDDWIGRYSLSETMRQYANDRLSECGEAQTYSDRHLAHFLALAEEAEPQLIGPEQQQWLECLDEEHDNLRVALLRSLEGRHRVESGLRLATAIARFWSIRGYNSEGREWLSRLLDKEPENQDLQIRGKALSAAGLLAADQGDIGGAEGFIDEDIALRRGLGDQSGVATSLNYKANLAYFKGDYSAEKQIREEALAIWRELEDPWGIALSLGNLGMTAYTMGDYETACSLQKQSLAIRRELGLQRGVANSLHLLGVAVHAMGDFSEARALLEASLEIHREIGWSKGVAVVLQNLGTLSLDEGNRQAARSYLEEGLTLCRDLGDSFFIAACLEVAAQIAESEREVIRAAQIWGAAERLREESGSAAPPRDRARSERHVASARSNLDDDDAFDRAWADGRTITLDHAINLALEGK